MIQTIALTFAVVDGLGNEVAQLIEPGSGVSPTTAKWIRARSLGATC